MTGALTDATFAKTFAEKHWGKKHAICAFDDAWEPPLSIDEVAGLALEDDVEARLVLKNPETEAGYQLVTTGIDESLLTSLPPTNWMLLVQDVDKHFPELRALYLALRTVPDWLIDDVMISIAAPGGSVGPHIDSYDVFLLQGHGTRHWQLGEPGQLLEDSPLRLLESAEWQHEYQCNPRDMLYVPPGVAHHGIATTLCSTWSIGFQAPLLSDIALVAGLPLEDVDPQTRYRYSMTGSETVPGLLPTGVVDNLPIAGSKDELLIALGILVTQCKAGLRPDVAPVDANACVHGYSRLAFAITPTDLHVFANGQHAAFERRHTNAIRTLCAERQCSEDPQSALYRWLVGAGVFMS